MGKYLNRVVLLRKTALNVRIPLIYRKEYYVKDIYQLIFLLLFIISENLNFNIKFILKWAKSNQLKLKML